MKKILYINYLANVKHSPGVPIMVSRYCPALVRNSMTWLYDLSPSQDLLGRYKDKQISNNMYLEEFLIEMNTEDAIKSLHMVYDALDYNDITLLCYEKQWDFCHRYIIAYLFKLKGVQVFDILPGGMTSEMTMEKFENYFTTHKMILSKGGN